MSELPEKSGYNVIAVNRAKKRRDAKCRRLGLACELCNLKCPKALTPDEIEKRNEKLKAAKEAAEKAAAEKAAKEAAEKAAAEKAAKEAAEKAAAEKAAKEAAEKAAAEKAAKEAAEKAAAEKAAKEAAEKAAAEKAAKEAAEKAAAEKAAKEAAEKAAAEKAAKEAAEKTPEQTEATDSESVEATPQEKGFKLSAPAYAAEVMPKMATKRGRKLIYTPKEVIYENSCSIEVTNKKNDEGIKVKNILEAEIKEGLKLGYLDKYDGLKASEIKEEYENDTIYEIADQEFKKAGLMMDGDKTKVYIFDWTGTGFHHIGYLPEKITEEMKPYLSETDKYSFDICGIITGGKCKTITKDEATGKYTVSKGKDGDYGVDIDITVLKRKD